MNKTITFLLTVLAIALGAVFLYSAWTKLFPIQAFEYTIVEFTHISLIVAKIVARFFVGLEAGLGALMILHLFGNRKLVLKTALGLLVIFSLFLIYLWATAGNNVNCGCFGDTIWMRPSSSLLKNLLMMAVLVLLIRQHRGFTYKWANITAPVLAVGAITTMYIVFPVYEVYHIDLKPLYTDKQRAPPVDLTKGKHIIAFLNPFCMHCRKAAFIMHQMEASDPAIPFFMIIGGTESDISGFWMDAQAQNVPYMRLNRDQFLKYTGGVFPQIYWIDNSWVEENTTYPELNQKLIEKWMK